MIIPLHRPTILTLPPRPPHLETETVETVEVCIHCWEILCLGNQHYLQENDEVPDFLIWPCPSSERMLDLLTTRITEELVEGIARADHDLGEMAAFGKSVAWSEISEDDRADAIFEARAWMVAARAYVAASRGLLGDLA